VATLSLLAFLLVSTSAFADRPAPEVTPYEPGPFESVTPGPPLPNGPCTMGINGAPAYNVNYLLPPDDNYLTLLDPSNCGVCPNGSIAVNAAHVALQFPTVCAQPVVISIIGAINQNGCMVPDPTTVLCPPIGYNLNPGATGSFLFNLPIPSGCCITTKAFLSINFIAPGAGCNTSATRPRLITTASCAPCTSWNIWVGGTDDLCVDIGFPGNPIMYADGDCCSITPAEKATWGQLKSLYR
jgi:hypothetical protein